MPLLPRALALSALLGTAAAAQAQTPAPLAPAWVSIGPDDRQLSWALPPSGELYRVCECGNNVYGERLCHCTQPAATLSESMETPIALDVQQRRGLPASAPAPRATRRYAGQPGQD